MTHADALDWWYGRVDFERRAPQPGDLKLDQMRALLAALGDPHHRLRIIHVAGSKGKGSTAAMLAAVLRSAGYRTGLFTSPHLCTVEERIQIDDGPIAPDELAALISEIRDALPPGVSPTFFEVGTAAGFMHFLRRRVDLAVVEVGLGGRFDSTNVCTPLVSVITSISHDHTKILGERLEQIAFEKAGIIKPGVPVISGALAQAARPVIERVAAERGAELIELNRDFFFDYEPGEAGGRPPRATIRTPERSWPPMPLSLLGRHQAANAAVAVACVERLREQGLRIPEASVATGLAGVRWPARLEVLGRAPWIVLDCAHNTASVQAMIDTLNESFSPRRKLLVFAASSDKDVPGMMQLLAPQFDGFYLTRFGKNARAVEPGRLAAWLAEMTHAPRHKFDDAAEAWRAARAAAGPDDLVAVSGSVFLAGELRPVMLNYV